MAAALTLDQLSSLRGKTEAVTRFFHAHLKAHLDTLRPLFAPSRLLGHHARTDVKTSVPGADRAVAQLHEQYPAVGANPFGLLPQMDDAQLGAIEARLDLHPWEYTHEITEAGEAKRITMTSPVRWVLSYPSSYSLAELRQCLAGKGERRPEDVAQFVVNALVLDLLVGKYPGIAQLFADLRYTLATERAPDLGSLPLVTVTACLSSFAPADDLIGAATRLSGVPAFIELIDVEALDRLEDGLKGHLAEMLR